VSAGCETASCRHFTGQSPTQAADSADTGDTRFRSAGGKLIKPTDHAELSLPATELKRMLSALLQKLTTES